MQFHEAGAAEKEDLLQLHRLAFNRDDEATLVARLLGDPSAQPALSLIAAVQDRPIGHALFTRLDLVGPANPVSCALLAPLAVLPSHQQSGAGRGLIKHGCQLLAGRGIKLVFVLGDPHDYTRCGFSPAIPLGLFAPYAIEPAPAWMVRALEPNLLGTIQGSVRCAQALAVEPYWRE